MTPTDIGHGRGWLDAPAAASLARVDAQLGRPLDVNDAGRTWQEQYDAWVKYQNGGNLALHPDNPLARHTKGLAVDTDDRLTWIGEHGWVADIGGEPWHHEYRAWLDQHINDTPHNPLTSKEDHDMRFLYVTDSVDGNGIPGWALLNVNTGKVRPLRNNGKPEDQERANSWARVWGSASSCTRQDMLNAIAAIQQTA